MQELLHGGQNLCRCGIEDARARRLQIASSGAADSRGYLPVTIAATAPGPSPPTPPAPPGIFQGCDDHCNSDCNSDCDDSCDFFSKSCDGGCDGSCDGSCDDSCTAGCDEPDPSCAAHTATFLEEKHEAASWADRLHAAKAKMATLAAAKSKKTQDPMHRH